MGYFTTLPVPIIQQVASNDTMIDGWRISEPLEEIGGGPASWREREEDLLTGAVEENYSDLRNHKYRGRRRNTKILNVTRNYANGEGE